MKQIFVLCALLLGVCAANAQETDTVKYATGNDLYRGITRKLPYRQMVTPYGVEVTFAKTVHIIFPAAVRILHGVGFLCVCRTHAQQEGEQYKNLFHC